MSIYEGLIRIGGTSFLLFFKAYAFILEQCIWKVAKINLAKQLLETKCIL